MSWWKFLNKEKKDRRDKKSSKSLVASKKKNNYKSMPSSSLIDCINLTKFILSMPEILINSHFLNAWMIDEWN